MKNKKYNIWFVAIICGSIGGLFIGISRIYDLVFRISTQSMIGLSITIFQFFIFCSILALFLLALFRFNSRFVHINKKVFRVLFFPPLEAIIGSLMCALLVFILTKIIFILGMEHDPLAYIAVIYYGSYVFIGLLGCSFINELVYIKNTLIKSSFVLMGGLIANYFYILFLEIIPTYNRLGRLYIPGGHIYLATLITVIICTAKITHIHNIELPKEK